MYVYFYSLRVSGGARGSAVGSGTELHVVRSRVRFPIFLLKFFIDIILSVAACNRNKYKVFFLWGKGSRCVGLTTLPPSCADCLEISEPQPLGTLRACPGLYRDCFTFTVKDHNSSNNNRSMTHSELM